MLKTFWLALVALCPFVSQGLPASKNGLEGLSKLEQDEVTFMRSSLKREINDLGGSGVRPDGVPDDSAQAQETAVRRAYRNIARRYKRNIFSDSAKFEFQMRILNLARDFLMQGSHLGEGWDTPDEEESAEAAGSGRELAGASRASDDILKQVHSWQEYALEEGIHFDDPDKPYFVGHTQHQFREAFAKNWTKFVRDDLAELWPAAGNLRLQVELDGTAESGSRPLARPLAVAQQRLVRESVAIVAGAVHACGGREPSLEGPLPEVRDKEAWISLQLRASQSLRHLVVGDSNAHTLCPGLENSELRLALLEANLEALEHLAADDASGRASIADEIRAAHAVVSSLKTRPSPEHCRDMAVLKRTALERLWEDYRFGPVVAEAYPADVCALDGLEAFVEFHVGPTGEQLEQRAEPDKSVLKALRSILAIQRALKRPASLNSAQWGDVVRDLESAVWQGVAFPELHDAAGRLMGEAANAGLMPEILEAVLEIPPVIGGPLGTTLRFGREPGDVRAPKAPRFVGMDVPGYSMKPIQRYEERAMHVWGDEEVEERWDPIRMALSYIDLTPACDLPLQVAMCFISAALWFWRALQLLGDNCGGDGWLETYIFEELWNAPAEGKRIAMQFSLKRAIFEVVNYASLLAEGQLMPGPRLVVQRSAYLLLRKVSARFGTDEDASSVVEQLRRTLMADRVSPFWTPPVLLVSDAVFVDILSGRLHQSFMEVIREAPEGGPRLLPSAVAEYTLFEAALLGGSDMSDVTYARYEFMHALLRDSGRGWEDVETIVGNFPLQLNDVGFTTGPRPRRLRPSLEAEMEWSSVRGITIDMTTGRAELILARPSAGRAANLDQMPLTSTADIARFVSILEPTPLHISLDLPAEKGAGAARYPHSVFQRATLEPKRLPRETIDVLLHAALTLQQVAAGTEVALKPPFPLRRCSDGLCRGLPTDSAVQPLPPLRGETWDTPSRLVFECSRIQYWQRVEGTVLEVRFGVPKMEVHPGKPLRDLNEEEFQSWSVTKLRNALKKAKFHMDIPALEKHELVSWLLEAVQNGAIVEDEEEAGDPLISFSRRFTHHLDNITKGWPHIGRLGPLCVSRAVGLVLQMQLEQMTAAASEHVKEHSGRIRQEQLEGWLDILADVHKQILQETGFVTFDPGDCFLGDENGRTFAACCSVGNYQDSCWASAGGSVRQCCGSDARRDRLRPELVASVAAQLGQSSPKMPGPDVLIPAVSEWLAEPTGRNTDGTALSEVVVGLLVDIGPGGSMADDVEEQARRPGKHLREQINAFQPLFPAWNLSSSSPTLVGGEREWWIPLPTLSSAMGKKAVYITVVLAPQLQQISEEEGQNLQSKAMEERLSFDNMAKALAENEDRSQLSPTQKESGWEDALSFLDELEHRTTVFEKQNQARGGKREVPISPENTGLAEKCSFDGWTAVEPKDVRAKIVSGTRVRLTQRGSDDLNGQEAVVRTVTTAVGDPGELVRLWEVGADGEQYRYLDLADGSQIVAMPCTPSPAGVADSVENHTRAWPSCIEANVGWPSADGAGLFVNLEALSIKKGCFQNDCSHSDHFACETPADCSATCARIGACRRWSFWEIAPSTCWLRGSLATDENRQEAFGTISGDDECTAPHGNAGREPTLFEIILGPAGTPHPGLWDEWHLVETLEEFGGSTVSEIQRARATPRQRLALRAAALGADGSKSGAAAARAWV